MVFYLGLSELVCGMGCHALKLNGTKLVSKHIVMSKNMTFVEYEDNVLDRCDI